MTGKPQAFERVVEEFRRAFHEHGDSPAAIFDPKGRQKVRYRALTGHLRGERFSVLDFGCGLAHLYPYLAARFPNCRYTGVDLVPEFIEHGRRAYPNAGFHLIKSVDDLRDTYDHIVLSTVFNFRYVESLEENRAIVRDTLRRLFAKARVSLAVDFMTDYVDFQQQGAYHENADEIRRFAERELTRRLILDQSYAPYEFSLILFKDATIVPGRNVFAAADES